MPTENRSSNTEMVSELLPCPFCGQQDFLIERLDSDASVVICQGLTGPHEACLARGPVGVAQDEGEEQPGRDKAVELWNSRAEQGQGEPVALPARWTRQNFPAYMSDDAAMARVETWNACLDEIAKLGPLYTHADPGEVEPWKQFGKDACEAMEDRKKEVYALRAENEAFDAGMRNLACQLSAGGYNAETLTAAQLVEKVQWGVTNLAEGHARIVDSLRAQLAERDALRSFANEIIAAAYEGGSFEGGDIQDMAVKHGLLRIESRVAECGESCACREYGFPAECYRKTALLSASAEPSAPKDWCSTMERPKSKCGCPDCGSSLVQIGEPSAPVERDERAAFEHFECEDPNGPQVDPMWMLRCTINPDNYGILSVQSDWQAWQSRAALERKPS